MDINKKKNIISQAMLSFGAPLVVSAIMTQLDTDLQYWLGLSLGFILMIASWIVYPKD